MVESALEVREICANDDVAVKTLIQSVLKEYGGDRPGTAFNDPELGALSRFYSADPRRKYWVVTLADQVVGGCGVAEFDDQGTAELQKLYFLPEMRGLGLGKRLVMLCEEHSRTAGFKSLYLETLSNMDEALGLYGHLGFEKLAQPKNASEHGGCDVWLEKQL